MHPTPVARLFDEQQHHPEADRSPTLAARYYVDPEIFEAEKEAIFYRSWQWQNLEHMAARSDNP